MAFAVYSCFRSRIGHRYSVGYKKKAARKREDENFHVPTSIGSFGFVIEKNVDFD